MDESPQPQSTQQLDAQTLFVIGFFFELGLVFVAAIIAWLIEGNPFPFSLRYDMQALVWGLAATLPWVLIAVVLTSEIGRRAPFVHRIYEHLKKLLGSGIRHLRFEEIVILSAAAGIGEEVLFRGVLQHYTNIYVASLVFGLLHALTPSYFILATIIGFYLGWLQQETGNLLIPIIVHWLYDTVALYLLRRQLRKEAESAEQAADEASGV